MKRLRLLFCFLCVIILTGLISCGSDDDTNTLSVGPSSISFGATGGDRVINIKTDANKWNIDNSLDWVTLSAKEGTGGTASVTLTVTSRTTEGRTGTILVSAGSAAPVEVTITQQVSDFLYSLTADQSSISFTPSGGAKSLQIVTDAPAWSISASEADWLQFSKTTGVSGTTTITLTAAQNAGASARTTTLNLSADGALPVQIAVSQPTAAYPSYNVSPLAPDQTGMTSDAVTLAAKMDLGWNLGNTLEATGGETAWGNPKTTKALIDLVKQNGFNAVRLPCSWNQYMDNAVTAKLSATWLARIKEVVQYCTDNDMYVVLNIHWDGGWLENNCTPDKQLENNAKQKAFWEQIATALRDFDEHLLFASANEPNVDNAEQMAVLLSYHQTFINAVRSTGGHNSYRVLVVQGPSTDITKTHNLMTTMPTDEVEDRLMAEVHYYTPYNFCLMTADADWGKMFYYWGKGYHSATETDRNPTYGEEADLDAYFAQMKNQFVDKGIPVILGEYAAIRRLDLSTSDAVQLHLAARAYYLQYVTQHAKANGLIPFYWDAGSTGNQGTGLFNRTNNTVADEQALAAITGL